MNGLTPNQTNGTAPTNPSQFKHEEEDHNSDAVPDPKTLKTFSTGGYRARVGRRTEEPEAGQDLRLLDFENVNTLSLSEARLIANTVFSERKKRGENYPMSEESERMLDYVETFARLKSRPVLVELEDIMRAQVESGRMQRFEASQLVTLCPSDADEAKTLIPSLSDKISDNDLTDILDDINERRRMFGVGEEP